MWNGVKFCKIKIYFIFNILKIINFKVCIVAALMRINVENIYLNIKIIYSLQLIVKKLSDFM